jgi:hypothetical protein
MSTATTHSRAARIVERVSGIWSELDYAQRRLFEIRTEIPEVSRGPRHHDEDGGSDRLSDSHQVRAWDEFEL